MVKKAISIIVIILGVGIILAPSLKHHYYMNEQKKIMKDLEEQILKNPDNETVVNDDGNQKTSQEASEAATDNSEEVKENPHDKEGEENQLNELLTQEPPSHNVEGQNRSENQASKNINKDLMAQAMGIIVIPEIDLSLPLFNKATDSYLKVGPCRIEGTGEVGQLGNLVIAGHRNYRYGDQFNRLGELKQEDLILIHTVDGAFVYKVKEAFIVQPEDVWVMDKVEDEKMITLITCHPINTGENRLIIRGEQLEKMLANE